MKEFAVGIAALACALLFLAGVFFGVGWAYQNYRLWAVEYSGQREVAEQNYRGQAIKARADNERLVRVTQAEAELAAAQATAQAIELVGVAAQKYPEYRQQEFILGFAEALRAGKIDQVIYVPTEANIPIMEAGKREDVKKWKAQDEQ